MNKEPAIIKLKNGNVVLHESGIYFFDKNEPLENKIPIIKERKRPEISVPKEQRDKLAKVVIYISSNCNLKCIYCYANSGINHKVVSVKKAKVLIDFVASKCDRLILDFHGGGEPLLYFDIIKEIYEYAKNTKKLYRTVLISNGVIENNRDEILNWIVTHINNMAISCDGPQYIQEKNRPHSIKANYSSLEVESTIKFLVEHDFLFTVRSTITSESSKKLLEIIKYFYSLGVKYVVFSPCYNYGRSSDKELIPDYKTYGDNYMDALDYAVKHKVRLSSNSFRFPGYHYCGALAGFNIALTVDGDISTCYEVTENKNDKSSDRFIVGKVTDESVELFKDKIIRLHTESIKNNESKCKNCSYHLVCRGGCPVKKIRNSNDSLDSLCKITHYLVPKILSYLMNNAIDAEYVLKGVKYEEMDL